MCHTYYMPTTPALTDHANQETTTMKTITTLNSITRAARNTTMGNPNWNLETDQGVFKLETNGSLGYALDNPEYQEMIGQRVTITHTKSMRFSNIELA